MLITRCFGIAVDQLALLIAIVRNDVVPFLGGGTRNKGDDRFGFAHVEDFVRNAGFDVNEIAGFVLDHLFQAGAEFVTHSSFDDVKDHLKIDMNVRVGDPGPAHRRDDPNPLRASPEPPVLYPDRR